MDESLRVILERTKNKRTFENIVLVKTREEKREKNSELNFLHHNRGYNRNRAKQI